jgi:hypothetical protein
MSEREGVKLDVAAIRARAEAATPGPWRCYRGKLRPQFPTNIIEILGPEGKAVVAWTGFDGVYTPKRETNANGLFIAHARTDIPALLDALASERARADALERKVADCEAEHPPEPWAAELQARADAAEKVLGAILERQTWAGTWSRGGSCDERLTEIYTLARAALARGEKEKR